MKRLLVAIIFFLFLSSAGMTFAQSMDRQQITGTVTDPTGAAVPDADIVVTNEATGASRTVKSNTDGNFTVLNIPVGVYTITTTVNGFNHKR
jgi:hypothetical protein